MPSIYTVALSELLTATVIGFDCNRGTGTAYIKRGIEPYYLDRGADQYDKNPIVFSLSGGMRAQSYDSGTLTVDMNSRVLSVKSFDEIRFTKAALGRGHKVNRWIADWSIQRAINRSRAPRWQVS